jgi:outer membrane protein TolC
MRILLTLIFIATCFHVLPAQGNLTLEEAIRLSLDNNYSIRIARNDQKISDNNHQPGNAGMLPVVDLEAGQNYSRQNIDLDIQGQDGIFSVSQNWAKSNRLTAAARLGWTIFDGLGMFMTMEKLEAMKQWGELNTLQQVQNTVAQVTNAYYQVMLENERLRVLEENLEISLQRQLFAQNRYEVGKASKVDYLAAQVDYNSDRTGIIVQQQRIDHAKVDLNVVIGRDVDAQFEIESKAEIDSTLQYYELEQDVNRANPDLLKAMQDHNIAYYQYREEKASRFPSIGLDMTYSYTDSENEAGQLRASVFDGISYGLTARWNIFDGNNSNRRVQNARVEHETTMLVLDELRLQVKGDLRKVYIRYQNSMQVVALERENLEVARENEEIAIERFRLGASDFLVLREAQRNLVDANGRLLDAIFSTKLAETELLRLSGNLVPLEARP